MKTAVRERVAFERVAQVPPAHVPATELSAHAPRPGWTLIGEGLFGAPKVQFCPLGLKTKLDAGKASVRAVKSTMKRVPVITPTSPALLVAAKVPPTRSKLAVPTLAAITSGGAAGPTRECRNLPLAKAVVPLASVALPSNHLPQRAPSADEDPIGCTFAAPPE